MLRAWFLLLLSLSVVSSARLWTSEVLHKDENITRTVQMQGTLRSSPVEKGFCDTVPQLSGYYSIQGMTNNRVLFKKHYFYWFFESRTSPSSDPVLIWLTGGPGCSSMLALLGENGPCYIDSNDKEGRLKTNPFSWNTNANIMWIDQPAGVGFSYSENAHGYDTNEEEVGNDMYQFLQAFFQDNTKYQKLPFYVFGESYGGHYVPAIAYRVYQGNQQLEKKDVHIHLKGIGIGNGLTDPQIQYQYYPQMAYNNSYQIKAVSEEAYNTMMDAVPYCTQLIRYCQTTKAACLAAELYCNSKLFSPYQLSGRNVYDIREKCEHFPMCYDFSAIKTFLRLPSTLKKLNVDTSHSAQWQECNMIVHTAFTFDWMRNFDQLVIPLLHETKDPIQVLVYAGDADYIVNWLGCKAWTVALPWKNKDQFNQEKDKDWINASTKEKMGETRSYGGLTFTRVFEAGHMVPMNQPRNALYMVNQFIHGIKEGKEGKDVNEVKEDGKRIEPNDLFIAKQEEQSKFESANVKEVEYSEGEEKSNSKNTESSGALHEVLAFTAAA